MTGWTEEGIISAWRVLSVQEAAESWRFVHITSLGNVTIKAGCHFPLGREALIVSFPDAGHLESTKLQEVKGFKVFPTNTQRTFRESTAFRLLAQLKGLSALSPLR